MASSAPINRRIRAAVGEPPLIDISTTAVILVMSAGFPIAGWLYHHGQLPAWATVLIGTFLMNLSFTAWHEPAHQNYSRYRWVNLVAGWLASFASMYPGYFARRREHLIHHRYEGVEGKDPVYPRIQSSFWTFPLTLLREALRGGTIDVPASFLRMTKGQRISDALSNLLALGVVALCVAAGYWQAVVLVWVVPRLIIFLAHAYYVCFFPHNDGGDGFVVARLRTDNPLLQILTMNQHLHGLHHRWPWIPWHKYQQILRSFPEEVEAMTTEEMTSDLKSTETAA